jgi:hypothetical protein
MLLNDSLSAMKEQHRDLERFDLGYIKAELGIPEMEAGHQQVFDGFQNALPKYHHDLISGGFYTWIEGYSGSIGVYNSDQAGNSFMLRTRFLMVKIIVISYKELILLANIQLQ